MNFIYHGVPETMIGNQLVPLNQMHGDLADIHNKYLEKYKGREEILKRKIPLIGCLWNDVVQFLPLHPQKVFELQVSLGIISEIPAYKFYEIPTSSLELDKAVVFFKTAPGEENTEVKWLKSVDFSVMQEMPEATVEYYKTLIGSGELPFNYQFIPHIVYKGSVDISEAKVVTLSPAK